MPTQEQLMAYSRTLPEIYKVIFWAFPSTAPERKAGDGLAFSSLATYFEEHKYNYDLEEIIEACRRLEENGFLEIRHDIIAQPTPLGEQLIGVITGKWASKRTVPELPKPTW